MPGRAEPPPRHAVAVVIPAYQAVAMIHDIVARPVAERIRPTEQGYDFEIAFLLAALAEGLRVRSVRVPTIYQGQPSHFRRWGDTWRQTRVFTRYGRQIIFGLR